MELEAFGLRGSFMELEAFGLRSPSPREARGVGQPGWTQAKPCLRSSLRRWTRSISASLEARETFPSQRAIRAAR